MYDPFATLVANAEQREAKEAELREQAKAETRQREIQEAEQYELNRRCINFQERFLSAVVKRVVLPMWSSSYIRQVEQYAKGLLTPHGDKLPKIDSQHSEKIMDIFARGLKLATEHDEPIPADTFYGQRLLAEKEEATPAKPERIVYTPAPPRNRPVNQDKSATNVVKLKPAFTAKPKKKAGRKAS